MTDDTVQPTSPQLSLNTYDWKKVGEGAAIAFIGAFITYIASNFIFGQTMDWKIFVAAGVSVGVNAAWKYFRDNSQ